MELLKQFGVKLCEVKSKLSTLKNPVQDVPQLSPYRNEYERLNPQNVHVHHHPGYFGWNYPIYQPVNIINCPNNTHHVSSAREEDDEISPYPLLGLFVGGVVALGGTYLIATDEYTQFQKLDIDKDILELKTMAIGIKNNDLTAKVMEIESTYNFWKEKMCKRTFSQKLSKICGTGSGLTVAGGLFWGSSMAMTGGSIGLIAASCYYIWNSYGCENRFSEDLSLENFMISLRDANMITETIIFQMNYPFGVPFTNSTTTPIY